MSNFTEEVKEDDVKKRGKAKDAGKQIGVITRFNEDGQPIEGGNDDEEEDEAE